jgi:hypothetical protein
MSLTAVAAPEMMRFRDFCHRGYYIYDNIVFMTMVMVMMRR